MPLFLLKKKKITISKQQTSHRILSIFIRPSALPYVLLGHSNPSQNHGYMMNGKWRDYIFFFVLYSILIAYFFAFLFSSHYWAFNCCSQCSVRNDSWISFPSSKSGFTIRHCVSIVWGALFCPYITLNFICQSCLDLAILNKFVTFGLLFNFYPSVPDNIGLCWTA